MGFLSFTAWQFAARRGHLRRRAAHHSPAQPAAVSRGEVGGDGLSAARPCSAIAASCRSATSCCSSCGRPRCCCSGWPWPGRSLPRGEEEFDDRQPLHAVIVVDNSLSMAYESLEGDAARARPRSGPGSSSTSCPPAAGFRSFRPAARATATARSLRDEGERPRSPRQDRDRRSLGQPACGRRTRRSGPARRLRSWPSGSSSSATSRS